MRVAITFILAGAMLALGGCSTPDGPRELTQIQQAECMGPGTRLKPTGRHTGDVRQDFRCVSVHARVERNGVTDAGAQRSAGIDRAARRGG